MVLYEEPRLRRQFGPEWTAYASSFGRWLPRVGFGKRKALNTLTAVSLLLCVLVCVLWVRNYWVAYHFTGDRKFSVRYLGGDYEFHEHNFSFVADSGRLSALWLWAPEPDPTWLIHGYHPKWRASVWTSRPDPQSLLPNYGWPPGARVWGRLGLHFHRSRTAHHFKYEQVSGDIPLWMLAAGLAVLPGRFAAARLVRARRVSRGHCPACSYDLRATPGRCPECGTMPPSAPAA